MWVAMLRAGRDLLVGLVLAGALVAFVLGQPIIGAVVGLFGLWQLVLVMRGRPSLLGVDQRWADKEGKPNLRG